MAFLLVLIESVRCGLSVEHENFSSWREGPQKERDYSTFGCSIEQQATFCPKQERNKPICITVDSAITMRHLANGAFV